MILTLAIISLIFLLLILINFYFRHKTFQSLDKFLEKVKWKNNPKKKFVKKCYILVSNRFIWASQCWVKYFWRNFYYTNLWKLGGKALPCHLQNAFFQHCLLKRFKKRDIKTKFTCKIKDKVFVHFYSQVKVNGKWFNIDVHQKKTGVPFGKTIHDL